MPTGEGNWLATSESNRALPPYQGGPFNRLGRGQRKMRVSSPRPQGPPLVFKASCRAGGTSSKGGEGEGRTRKGGEASLIFETSSVANRIASPRFAHALIADGGRIERPRATAARPPVSSRAPYLSVNHPGRSMKDSNLRRRDRRYALAGRCSSRCANAPCVRREGVEPSRLAALVPGTSVSACSTTSA